MVAVRAPYVEYKSMNELVALCAHVVETYADEAYYRSVSTM
jgi:hypothetical protein